MGSAGRSGPSSLWDRDMTNKIQHQLKPEEDGSLIISVGEARKLLGIDGNGMNDDELSVQIALLQELSIEVIKVKRVE